MEGKMPNLLIIGAMKSGTSSLHDYLSLHPEIFMSSPKEIHYFADQEYSSKPLEWYKSFFKTDKKVIGCSPQSYTKCHNKYYKNIPERIKKYSPDIKMIYIVRDPLKRYTSHILESYHCDPPEDIEYSKESGNYLKTSLYFMQINEYLKHFKKEQIHILALEDLQKNRLNELNKIFNFLEVNEMKDESVFDFISNDSESKKHPRIIRTHILFRLGNRISPKITNIIATKIVEKYFAHQTKKPTLAEEEIITLKTQLSGDIAKFRALTGNPFSDWSI